MLPRKISDLGYRKQAATLTGKLNLTKEGGIMSDQFFTSMSQPTLSPIKLWSSRVIGWSSFILGFPAGVALASINWLKMGHTNKIVAHLIAVGLFTLGIIFIPISENLGFLINIGLSFYLEWLVKNDTEEFKSTCNNVQTANWLGGFGIGIGFFVLYVVALFMLIILLSLFGFPIPE